MCSGKRNANGTGEDEKVGGDASSFAKATADREAAAREGEDEAGGEGREGGWCHTPLARDAPLPLSQGESCAGRVTLPGRRIDGCGIILTHDNL